MPNSQDPEEFLEFDLEVEDEFFLGPVHVSACIGIEKG
jgi:hypothetical protein